jgi:hypothetical protein
MTEGVQTSYVVVSCRVLVNRKEIREAWALALCTVC